MDKVQKHDSFKLHFIVLHSTKNDANKSCTFVEEMLPYIRRRLCRHHTARSCCRCLLITDCRKVKHRVWDSSNGTTFIPNFCPAVVKVQTCGQKDQCHHFMHIVQWTHSKWFRAGRTECDPKWRLTDMSLFDFLCVVWHWCTFLGLLLPIILPTDFSPTPCLCWAEHLAGLGEKESTIT
jgi:hypothetical protein